jgi:hypothetical protein
MLIVAVFLPPQHLRTLSISFHLRTKHFSAFVPREYRILRHVRVALELDAVTVRIS